MHEPVLLEEVLESLQIRADGKYVDGTLGQAGHAKAIAERLGSGRILGLEVDPSNLKSAEDRLQPLGHRAFTLRADFRELPAILKKVGWDEVDGMLFDLGVSLEQLSGPSMSFASEAPLDMRINPDRQETALTYLQKTDERSLADLFFQYGEFKGSRRLARKILADVSAGQLRTNSDLAALCERVLGRSGPRHPATRVFLALRAAVNDENGAVMNLLKSAPPFLSVGGRLAIITFHSLEDRIVKHGFRDIVSNGMDGRSFSLVHKKAIEPTQDEQRQNPRSRSAKLRVIERVS